MKAVKTFFKTFLLWELLKGLKVTGSHLLQERLQFNILKKKHHNLIDLEGFMHSVVMKMEKSAALLVNYAKLYALH